VPATIHRCHLGSVACTAITPSAPSGAVVLVHGYGGCKDEMLGLAVRAGELDLAAYAIDLRGHGASAVSLDTGLADDVETAIAYARHHGKVTAVGHSLGGRLALVSSADFALGISPAFASKYGPKTRAILGSVRDGRVRQAYPGVVFAALGELPPFEPRPERPARLLYGSRDLPEVSGACRGWAERGVPAVEIANALHSDICFLERTFDEVARTLATWFGFT
jgi:dienelactone hydrolase